jgi:uridine monophosphate synthetase
LLKSSLKEQLEALIIKFWKHMKKNYALFLFVLLCFGFANSYGLEALRSYSKKERQLMLDLYEIGIFNFDTESWKSSLTFSSPYYVDLRHIISYPHIFKDVILSFKNKAKELSFDTICGVPYAALPMAANLAYEIESPLIMRRTKSKEYGTNKKIEGLVIPNMHCLIIDDVITTATSLFETIRDLEEEKIIISDCIILFDRQQGGVEFAIEKGYNIHTIFTITDFMYILQEEGKIDSAFAESVINWTRKNQVPGINWKI